MRRNIFNSLLFLAFVSVIMACKTKKLIVKPPKTVTETPVDSKKSETIKELRSKDISFNTLSLKAKANLDVNGNSNNVNMNIRMEKDKKIWVSITALGIEVARALITPDSIKVRNNLQGVYLKKPFNYVHTYTNKQVNFELLQAIFSGNTVKEFFRDETLIAQENAVWTLSGVNEGLAYRVIFNTLLKVNENNLNDIASGRSLRVAYGEYQNINGYLFPTDLKINSMAGDKRININMEFSKIESNVPLDFPFNVPNKYEVIN
ncbi:DUF4292 domain-containing protein [Pedobacter foliorum]|uniref:DUF4292 domain-containing protein n=1 Tax=Pedobacter foliorum TaxID=2739058 RepID=UPI001564C48D|nr:DUF4292 domain-containing protein [Pedobacter foliorum]NRF39242.1 DUF4292 domain-containing protein [Pedobacter foliorum]